MGDPPTRWLPAGMRRLFRLPFRTFAHITRDLDEEVRFHLERRVEDLAAAGIPPEAARAEALRRFGDVEDLRAFCRSVERPGVVRGRIAAWLADLGQDVRFAGRQFLRSPGFSFVAVATIGLGIGATTTIYCAVHDLLLRPLPYRDAGRLVEIDESAFHGKAWLAPSRQVVEAWRAGSRSLEGILEQLDERWTLGGEGEPESVDGAAIAPDLVPFLGVRPILGRGFAPGDGLAGAPPVALIGEELWRRRFGARRDVVGRSLTLDGRAYTIVGVLPRLFGIGLFYGMDGLQVLVPLAPGAPTERVGVLARLRRDVTVQQAERELSAVPVSEAGMGPAGAHVTSVTGDFHEWYRSTLPVLLGAVALVLLVACANVANLLLMRAWSRHRELAVRAAIGAGRGRLVRQLLTESLLLAAAGGALGSALAWRAIPLVAALRPRTVTMAALATVRLDPAVLGFTMVVACITGLLFGLAPALAAMDYSVGETLKGTVRTASGNRAARRVRGTLVVAEIAVSTVLLVTCALLLRSLVGLARAQAQLYPPGLAAVQLELPADRFPSPAVRSQVLGTVLARARGIPGIEAAATALMPPWGGGVILQDVEIAGRSTGDATPAPALVGFNKVSPDYFRTSGITLLAGRQFVADTAAHEAVVGEGFARRYLAAGHWLGARFRFSHLGQFDPAAPWSTVVGVMADPRTPGETSTSPRPTVFEQFAGTGTMATILARSGNPSAVLPFLVDAIAQTDPALHVLSAQTVRMALADTRSQQRFTTTLLTTFAALALVLAAVGLYAVVAYAVRQRTHEIGVRVALGAGAGSVIGLVLRHSLGLSLGGVALGLAGAVVATRLVQSELYGVGQSDPVTFAAIGGIMALVALAASFFPARAALRVDPVEALRADG